MGKIFIWGMVLFSSLSFFPQIQAQEVLATLFEDANAILEGEEIPLLCDEGPNPFQDPCGSVVFGPPTSVIATPEHFEGRQDVTICEGDSCIFLADQLGVLDIIPEATDPSFSPEFSVYQAVISKNDFTAADCPDPNPATPENENIFAEACSAGTLGVWYRCLLLVNPTTFMQPTNEERMNIISLNGGSYPVQAGPFIITQSD